MLIEAVLHKKLPLLFGPVSPSNIPRDVLKKSVSESSTTASYLFFVKELQLNLFLFIRSICQENFDIFICTVNTMFSWVFTLDYINYAR